MTAPITELDKAHAAMEAAPDDAQARLAFYARLAASEVFLMLRQEPQGDRLDPDVFTVVEGQFVLIFDTEARLASFAGRAAPYAALSGRALAQMLLGKNTGLGLNLDVAPSAFLIPPEAVTWLADTLTHAPQETEARIAQVLAPTGLPEAVLSALDTRLAAAEGLARAAFLAEAVFEDGQRSHVLGLTGVTPGAEHALAQSVQEALVFSGVEAGAIDVLFLRDADPVTAQLARVALRFDLPQPAAPQVQAVTAPGRDAKKPPILR